MSQQAIAAEVQRLVALANQTHLTYSHGPATSQHIIDTQLAEEAPLDAEAAKLILMLMEEGICPKDSAPFIEWSGVQEFGIIGMCWFTGDKENWINVNQDGSVQPL
jgi:hypothetical protein